MTVPLEFLYATGLVQIAMQIMVVVKVVMIGRLVDLRIASWLIAAAFALMAMRRITALWGGLSSPKDWVVLVDAFVLPFSISALLCIGAIAIYEDLKERRCAD